MKTTPYRALTITLSSDNTVNKSFFNYLKSLGLGVEINKSTPAITIHKQSNICKINKVYPSNGFYLNKNFLNLNYDQLDLIKEWVESEYIIFDKKKRCVVVGNLNISYDTLKKVLNVLIDRLD